MKFLFTLYFCLTLGHVKEMPYATVQGEVTDERGELLVDVNVYIDSLHLGTISDLMGEYQLKNVPLGQHEISYSRIGYPTKKQTIDIRNPMPYVLDVVLKEHGY